MTDCYAKRFDPFLTPAQVFYAQNKKAFFGIGESPLNGGNTIVIPFLNIEITYT